MNRTENIPNYLSAETDKDTASVCNAVILFISIAVPLGFALIVFLPRRVFYDERINMHDLHIF